MSSDYDELSRAIDAGVLADDVVLGVSRALRGAKLADHQLAAVERAEWLLSYLSNPESPPPDDPQRSETLRELVSTQHQAQQVARERSPSTQHAEYFRALLESLRLLRRGESRPDDDRFEELLDFFETLGHVTHAEAGDEVDNMSQPAWIPTQPTGVF